LHAVLRGAAVIALLAFVVVSFLSADEYDRAPIKYSSSTPQNVVSRLQQRLSAGEQRLDFEDERGYLRSVLRALSVPESSQMLVYSKTSLQRHRISPKSPRAVYFNDEVYIGFCQRGDVMEISAVDPSLGAVFYTLDQRQSEKPTFVRQGDSCLLCHASSHTQNVPGHLVRSVYVDSGGLPILSLGSHRIDHTSPLEKRWGGWYVSGTHGRQSHLGNLVVRGAKSPDEIDNQAGQNVTDLADRLNLGVYPSKHSDLVALMVLEHQVEAHNLITRANFETRQALHQQAELNRELGEPQNHRWDSTATRIKAAGETLVKYLLFCDEAELKEEIRGTSSFASDFQRLGPHDSLGHSLRALDLKRRLFKYPCSYLIYSAAFEALPSEVKQYVYQRLWDVLSGKENRPEFAHLSADDRKALVDILRATKKDLPSYWQSSAQ
jgi:hypothetical protein